MFLNKYRIFKYKEEYYIQRSFFGLWWSPWAYLRSASKEWGGHWDEWYHRQAYKTFEQAKEALDIVRNFQKPKVEVLAEYE